MQALRRRDRTALERATVSGSRTHKIRATECGKASAADTFTDVVDRLFEAAADLVGAAD